MTDDDVYQKIAADLRTRIYALRRRMELGGGGGELDAAMDTVYNRAIDDLAVAVFPIAEEDDTPPPPPPDWDAINANIAKNDAAEAKAAELITMKAKLTSSAAKK